MSVKKVGYATLQRESRDKANMQGLKVVLLLALFAIICGSMLVLLAGGL